MIEYTPANMRKLAEHMIDNILSNNQIKKLAIQLLIREFRLDKDIFDYTFDYYMKDEKHKK